MKNIEIILKDYLPATDWGASLINPQTGFPEPISGDRVKKLLARMDKKHYTKFGGKYYIWKYAPDPRERNVDGTVHWGRVRQG